MNQVLMVETHPECLTEGCPDPQGSQEGAGPIQLLANNLAKLPTRLPSS